MASYTKYLEYIDGKSQKFWKVVVTGSSYKVTYGKIGTNGQSSSKSFSSEALAKKDAEKKAKAKMKKGYKDLDEANKTDAKTITITRAKPTKKEKKKLPKVETTTLKGETAKTLRTYRDDRFLHSASPAAIRYSNDGKTIYSLSQNAVFAWNAASGKLVGKYDFKKSVYMGSRANLEIDASNGDLLVFRTQGKDSPAILLDENLKKKGEISTENLQEDDHYDLHINDKQILIGDGKQLFIYDRKSLEQTGNIQSSLKYENYSSFLKITNDGTLAVFFNNDSQEVELIETESLKSLKKYKISNFDSDSFCLSPSGKLLAIFDSQGANLEIWELRSGKNILKEYTSLWRVGIKGIAFSPDDRYLTLSTSSPLQKCWDLKNNLVIWTRARAITDNAMAYSLDGKQIALAGGNRIHLLDAQTGLEQIQYTSPSANIYSLFYHQESNHLFCGTSGRDPKNYILDADKGSVEGLCYGYSPSQGQHKHEILMNSVRGQILLDLRDGLSRVVGNNDTSTQLGRDHFVGTKYNYSGKVKYPFTLYSKTGKMRGLLGKSEKTQPDGVAFSIDEKYIFGYKSKKLMVWSLAKQELLDTIEEHSAGISRIKMSPNGKHFITTDSSCHFLIWDTATRTVKHRLKVANLINHISFDDSGDIAILSVAHGQIQFWDLNNGKALGALEFSTQSTAVGGKGELFVADYDSAVQVLDASKFISTAKQTKSKKKKAFADWAALAKLDESALDKKLRAAKWTDFDLLTDTVPLRRLLSKLEKNGEAGPLHYYCTNELLKKDKRLIHRYGHKSEVTDSAVSPCQQWLASASWTTEPYEDGGELMIWERETGRCVNNLNYIDGGVGWPDYDCLEWSPDGTQLGMAYSTNCVGNFLPFDRGIQPLSLLCVTNGGNRPPGWEWTPDGRAIIVDTYGPCLCPLDKPLWYDTDVVFYENSGIPETLIEIYSEDIPEVKIAKLKPSKFDPEANRKLPEGFTFPHLKESPLTIKGHNWGNAFDLDPAIPLFEGNSWQWVIAFENGLVVCPSPMRDRLNEELNFTILNRFSWPFHWADAQQVTIVETLAEATKQPNFPLVPQIAALSKATKKPKVKLFVEKAFAKLGKEDSSILKELKDESPLKKFQLALQRPSYYQADNVLTTEQVNKESMEKLLGKVVLYADKYSPKRTEIGTVMAVTDKWVRIYHESEGSSGSSGGDFDHFIFIGEAKGK